MFGELWRGLDFSDNKKYNYGIKLFSKGSVSWKWIVGIWEFLDDLVSLVKTICTGVLVFFFLTWIPVSQELD